MIAATLPLLSLIEANRDVLDLYSITSSARPSSVGGISMLSAFAVFRLIVSLNLLGS
jgi:hypothetical protein